MSRARKAARIAMSTFSARSCFSRKRSRCSFGFHPAVWQVCGTLMPILKAGMNHIVIAIASEQVDLDPQIAGTTETGVLKRSLAHDLQALCLAYFILSPGEKAAIQT